MVRRNRPQLRAESPTKWPSNPACFSRDSRQKSSGIPTEIGRNPRAFWGGISQECARLSARNLGELPTKVQRKPRQFVKGFPPEWEANNPGIMRHRPWVFQYEIAGNPRQNCEVNPLRSVGNSPRVATELPQKTLGNYAKNSRELT